MFQIINIADLRSLWGKTATANLHFHISRLEDEGDLSLLPGTEVYKLKLYAVQLDLGDEPYLLFKSTYQAPSWIGAPGESRKGWQVIFSEEFARTHPRIAKDILELPFLQVPRPVPLKIEPSALAACTGLFETMADYAGEKENGPVLARQMHLLLLSLRRLFNKYSRQQPELQMQVKQAEKSLYVRFRNLLEKLNFQAPQEEFRHLAYYAETLEVNTHSLNSAVKRFSGHNALHLIQEKSLAEAKNLLRSTHLTVKEISYKMAFRDPTQFGVFFKKQTGITPAQFRENLRRWS